MVFGLIAFFFTLLNVADSLFGFVKVHMNFVAAPTKLGNDVFLKKLCVAACDVDVYILHSSQTVEDGFKISQQLHLVQKHIVHFIIFDWALNVGKKQLRIPVPLFSYRSNAISMIWSPAIPADTR